MREHIRTWTDPDGQGFRLELFDTGKQDSYGKQILAYEFYDQMAYPIFEGDLSFGFHQRMPSRGPKRLNDNEPVFAAADFHCSPLHCTDSDACIGALLSFLSLKPGDTDKEYFDDYTPEQMAWCLERAETLSLYANLLENPSHEDKEEERS